jgi:predicted dehydrogenase
MSHYQIASDCLNRGKHVFCEKPMVINAEQANSLRELVRKTKLKFQVNFTERFAIPGQEAKLSINNGEIGNILYLRGNFRWFMKKHANKHGAWAFDRSLGGGIIMEASVHLWDAVRFWTGKEVVDVVCIVHENSTHGKLMEDNVAAIAHLEGGAIACIDLSGSMPMDSPTDIRFEILGDRGCIYIDQFRSYLMVNSEVGHETNPEDFITGIAYPDTAWHSKIEGGTKRSQRNFISCIINDTEPSPGVEDGARACEISWAALKSLETRKIETVNYGK